MRTSILAALVGASVLSIAASACSAPDDEADGQGAQVHEGDGITDLEPHNLTAGDFGLEPKEIALTLDDGPGPRTVELAEFLVREHVPAVFFMVGDYAKANPSAVQRVAELSEQSGGLFIVANHSMTHTTPLPSQGTQGSIDEIMQADAVLAPNIARSQSTFPTAFSFFRPPYGEFAALGAANVERVNQAGASKYIGPVFWDIGGSQTARYSADWACWKQKVGIDRCLDGYVAETNARGKGVMLAHDVHSKTVDMLMGTGSANGRSLIGELRGQGYKFVSLRAHEDAVRRFQSSQPLVTVNRTGYEE